MVNRQGIAWSALSRQDLRMLVPMLVFLAGMIVLGAWIMDDAGISYAYARNLVEGYGFVSQPGREPVEGFSNFLWVLVLAVLHAFDLFQPVIVPKIVGAIAVFWSLLLMRRTTAHGSDDSTPAVLAGMFIAAAPPIVIWTLSGLENGLTLVLAMALYAVLVTRPARWELVSGALTALLAMNHPENALYAGAGLAACCLPSRDETIELPAIVSRGVRYLGAFTAIFLPFLTLRLSVFGLPVPHTYYAKRMYPTLHAHLADLIAHPDATIRRAWDLFVGIGGPVGGGLVIAGLAAAGYLAWRRAASRALAIAAAIQLVAIAAFLWMDADWMGEYRFATIATAFSLLVLALATFELAAHAGLGRRRRAVVAALGLAVAVAYASYLPRIVRFASHPPTSFQDVTNLEARKFDAYAAALGVREGSVLIADLGGMLYESRLTAYDAAGLCEPAVVRTLKQNTVYWLDRHPLFYDWVFDTIKPTFIHTNDFWTQVAAFEQDPRFERDYAPINTYEDGWVLRATGKQMHSGDWVRRDALHDPGDLDRLRSSYRPRPRPEPLASHLAQSMERLSGGFDPDDAPSVMERGLQTLYGEVDPNAAVLLFERVRRLSPNHYGAAYQRAVALDRAQRLDEGRDAWTGVLAAARAIGDPPILATAYHRLYGNSMEAGLAAMYEQHAPLIAAAHYRKVLQYQPSHYGATYQLATALDAAGKTDEATAEWRRALAMAQAAGDSATVRRASERLAAAPGAS